MPSITREMELFANIQSMVTDQLLAAINDSPTMVAQMLAYEANVASGYAKPIEAGGGSAYFPGKPGVLQFIQLDTSSLSNLSTSPKVMLAIDQLAHEFGHYAARVQDVANWASSGTTESRIVSCLTSEGYAVFNNYTVKREIEAAAQLRGETPYRSIAGGGQLLAVLDAIYYTTNGGYSVTDYAGAIGRLYGATTKPGSVNGDYATYVQMCTAIASGGGGANPAPMPVMSSVNGAWTTSWAEPDGSVVQLNIDWGQMATFVTGLGLTSARFRFDLEPNGNIAGDGGTSLLAGESGDDTIVGGDGVSLMLGGLGYDTYYVDEGDTIRDADGQGAVYLNGKQLTFATKKDGESVWKDSAGNTYALNGGRLEVNDPLVIEGFANGELGIYLDEEEDQNDPPKPPAYNPNSAIQRWDPLVLDLDGNGRIDAVASTVSTIYFDFNGDGISERAGWIGAQDGFLALDANANGVIDGLDELFGTNQIDGFAELAQHDSNGDGRIDSWDDDYAKLRVWQDANQDGISQSGELKTLDGLGITTIDLVTTPANTPLGDNLVTATGGFTRNGEVQFAADIHLAVNFAVTNANPNRPLDLPPTLDAEVFDLPWLRGYGNTKVGAGGTANDGAWRKAA